VEFYSDAGISGAKGRNGRPGLDTMLKDASRRKFDIVMAWAIDRLGRSLSDLLDTIQHLEACGVDLLARLTLRGGTFWFPIFIQAPSLEIWRKTISGAEEGPGEKVGSPILGYLLGKKLSAA
jgi:Resolvase, N terminal domain